MNLLTFGSRFARTLKDGQEPDELGLGEWKDVIEAKHDFDAHAWCYVRYIDGSPAVPAIRVPASLDVKGIVLCHFVFLDYDQNSNHEEVLTLLDKLPAGHYLTKAACIYPTKGGMRFVYQLAEPLMPDEFGPKVRGMAVELAKLTGLYVDPSTDQWSRCFRLPCVKRDDEKSKGPTWEAPYFFPAILTDLSIDPDDIQPYQTKLPWDIRSKGGSLSMAADEAPTKLDRVLDARVKLYKKALKNSRFKEYIFDNVEIQKGRRDQILLALAGEVVGKSFVGVSGSSAEEIYQLLLPLTDDMERDGEPWERKLWRLIQHSWNNEVKKERDRKEKEEQELSQRDGIVKVMLQSLPVEEVPNDPDERQAYLQRHYCLQVARGAFVVTQSGEYSRVPLNASQLPAHFNNGLQFLVTDGFRNQEGRLMSGQDILNNYSTNLDDVEYVPGTKSMARVRSEGNKRILEVVPFTLRQDLLDSAELDKEVGEWLDQFHDSKLLQRWIAAALALHRGPVASCYLNGPARVGKSMLAIALAECFHSQPIPAAQAFSEFNGALLTSPVIMIDEGLPTRLTGIDTADLFRSLVTGSPVSTQRKFQEAITSRIPYRLIFAANSYDMVRKLIGKRTMEPHDRDAFRERILVIETGMGPANYLDRRGAMQFTRYDKKGAWLGGDCRLARHMMKLYKLAFEESNFVSEGRLLVEGRHHPAFTLSFDLGGAGRDVVDDLTTDISKAFIKKFTNVELTKCMEIQGSTVWIKKRPYVKLCTTRNPLRAEQYSLALDRFLKPEARTCPQDMAQQVPVDIEKLLFCAASEGLNIATLQQIRLLASGVL